MSILAEAEADVATILDPSTGFGVVALYTPASGSPETEVNVTFTKAYVSQDVGADVEGEMAQCAFRTSDIPAAAQGDRFRIKGTSYLIVDPEVNGLEVTVCTLTEGDL